MILLIGMHRFVGIIRLALRIIRIVRRMSAVGVSGVVGTLRGSGGIWSSGCGGRGCGRGRASSWWVVRFDSVPQTRSSTVQSLNG